MGEWQGPTGHKVVPKDDDADSFIIEATISVCALLVVATICALALHWAGLI